MARQRRKQDNEAHAGHERWLISYADFITLLFALFVVMYAISSVNEGKYRVLSDSLTQAFRTAPDARRAPVLLQTLPSGAAVPVILGAGSAQVAQARVKAERRQQLRAIAQDVTRRLEPMVRAGQVRVSEGARGISIEINASALFSPGGAQLDAGAASVLRAIAEVVVQGDFPITVEGHTDTLPISTSSFPSNWELSAVRASSVVRLFVGSGILPSRLTAAGYGDQRPVADNMTPQGRARNRRVTILIESSTDVPSVGPQPVGGFPSMTPDDEVVGPLGTPANIRLVSRSTTE